MKMNLGIIWERSQIFSNFIGCEIKWPEIVAQIAGVDDQKTTDNLKLLFHHIGKNAWLKSADRDFSV